MLGVPCKVLNANLCIASDAIVLDELLLFCPLPISYITVRKSTIVLYFYSSLAQSQNEGYII